MEDIKEDRALTKDIHQDIPGILLEAFLAVARKTTEYKLGVLETRFHSHFQQIPAIQAQMIPFAEGFITLLKKRFPTAIPNQVRIGFDDGTREPVVLFVFPAQVRSILKDVRNSARELERAMWEDRKIDGMIWTLATDNPDQESINANFPVQRQTPF